MGGIIEESGVKEALYRIRGLDGKREGEENVPGEILDVIVKQFRAERAFMALKIPESERLRIEAWKGETLSPDNLEFSPGQGIAGWVALHGQPFLASEAGKEPRTLPMGNKTRSEMAAPMIEKGSVVGVIKVESETPRAYHEDDLNTLLQLTAEATRVLGRVWLIDHLEERGKQLEALLGMGRDLVLKLEMEDLLDSLTRHALKITRSRFCALYFYEKEKEALCLKSLAAPEGNRPYREELSLPESALGTAVAHAKQIEVIDLPKTEEHHFVDLIQKEGLVGMLATPIVYDGKPVGVLNVYTTVPHRFNDDEKKILRTLAGLGAVAIQNARFHRKILEVEESLRRSEKFSTLGFLAAEIAHEIRNPLTVIKLLFENLSLEFNPEDPKNTDVAVLKEKFNQLESIVTRVLHFGKAPERDHASHPLDEIISETLLLVRFKLKQHNIRISHHPSASPLRVLANKGQLQQVFLNLILNALEAMPEGGDILIKTYPENRARKAVAAVEISDTGNGFAEGGKDEVFKADLFGGKENSGLGLHIVHRILKNLRGGIDILKSSPSGTTLKLWIPVTDRGLSIPSERSA